jgi:hypothetical protein
MGEDQFKIISISRNDVRFELIKQLVRSLDFNEMIIFLSTLLAQDVAIHYTPTEFARESVQSRSKVVMPMSRKLIDSLRTFVSLRVDDHKDKNALMSYLLVNLLAAGIMNILELTESNSGGEWNRVYREITARMESMIKDEHGPDLASEKD